MGVVIACKIKLAVRACPVTLKFRLHHFFVRTNAALPEPFLEPQNFLFHPSIQLMLQVFRLTTNKRQHAVVFPVIRWKGTCSVDFGGTSLFNFSCSINLFFC